MKSPRSAAAAAANPPTEPWVKKTIELPPVVFSELKARAALEQRTLRETLLAAIVGYLGTDLNLPKVR